MNDKLLRAFIDASGFDIEEEYRVYGNVSGEYMYTTDKEPAKQRDHASVFSPERVEVDYKVTKKSFKLNKQALKDGIDAGIIASATNR